MLCVHGSDQTICTVCCKARRSYGLRELIRITFLSTLVMLILCRAVWLGTTKNTKEMYRKYHTSLLKNRSFFLAERISRGADRI